MPPSTGRKGNLLPPPPLGPCPDPPCPPSACGADDGRREPLADGVAPGDALGPAEPPEVEDGGPEPGAGVVVTTSVPTIPSDAWKRHTNGYVPGARPMTTDCVCPGLFVRLIDVPVTVNVCGESAEMFATVTV